MRTITYMKGGQVLTRKVPDLTDVEQAALDARKALIAKRRLQQEAQAERAGLRTAALDQIIRDGTVTLELQTYAASLDAIIAAEPKDVPSQLPAKPVLLRS